MSKLTEDVFKLTAPYDNPYQGVDPKILFVCSAGLLRSATGANHFAKKGYNTRNCGTHSYALIPLSNNLINWAHKIFFVNQENYDQATFTFEALPHLLDMLEHKSTVLNIPDNYPYNHPELIQLLEEQCKLS